MYEYNRIEWSHFNVVVAFEGYYMIIWFVIFSLIDDYVIKS